MTTESQIIMVSELTRKAGGIHQLHPMMDKSQEKIAAVRTGGIKHASIDIVTLEEQRLRKESGTKVFQRDSSYHRYSRLLHAEFRTGSFPVSLTIALPLPITLTIALPVAFPLPVIISQEYSPHILQHRILDECISQRN